MTILRRIRQIKDPSKTYGKGRIERDVLNKFVYNIESESKRTKNSDYEDCFKKCLLTNNRVAI